MYPYVSPTVNPFGSFIGFEDVSYVDWLRHNHPEDLPDDLLDGDFPDFLYDRSDPY